MTNPTTQAAGTDDRPPADDLDHEPIHSHFGLSYANYLVLHRTLMQSMPAHWQRRMVACLDELEHSFAHIEQAPAYDVTPGREAEYGELTREQRAQLGVTHSLGQYYDRDGRAHDSWERTLIPTADPIPHYDRGRTRIPPHQGVDQ